MAAWINEEEQTFVYGFLKPLHCYESNVVSQSWLKAFRDVCGGDAAKSFPLCYELRERFIKLACDLGLSPLLVVGCVLFFFLVLIWVLFSSAARVLRWYQVKYGSSFVVVAADAARELRQVLPRVYPPQAHSWYSQRGGHEPAVCAVCFKPVDPDYDVQVCEVCGTMVHDSCSRHALRDCKPMVVTAEEMPHDWRPAGVVLLSSVSKEVDSAAARLCVYCQEPCEVGLFAVEPIWVCSWCNMFAHVSCYVSQHGHLFSSTTKDALSSCCGFSSEAQTQKEKEQGEGAHLAPVPVKAAAPEAKQTAASVWTNQEAASSHQDNHTIQVSGPTLNGGLHHRQTRESSKDITPSTWMDQGSLSLHPNQQAAQLNGIALNGSLDQIVHFNTPPLNSNLDQRQIRESFNSSPIISAQLDIVRATSSLEDAEEGLWVQSRDQNHRARKRAARRTLNGSGTPSEVDAVSRTGLLTASSCSPSTMHDAASSRSRSITPPKVNSGTRDIHPDAMLPPSQTATDRTEFGSIPISNAINDDQHVDGPQLLEVTVESSSAEEKSEAIQIPRIQSPLKRQHRSMPNVCAPECGGMFATSERDGLHSYEHFGMEDVQDQVRPSPDICSLGSLRPFILPANCVRLASDTSGAGAGPDSARQSGAGSKRQEDTSGYQSIAGWSLPGRRSITSRTSEISPEKTQEDSATSMPPGLSRWTIAGRKLLSHKTDIQRENPNESTSTAPSKPPTAPNPGAAGGSGATSRSSIERPDGGGSKKKKKRRSWWSDKKTVKWRDHVIEGVPPESKPLLVFVNLKSGPQAGVSLRRNLLQLLHPLQVVELPREKPELALQCFANVQNLRILVVGGDGTVSWILALLDKLQAQMYEAGHPSWSVPPVAVLPMGTGNDLARTLGWGGGMGEVQRWGLPALLREVGTAAPCHVDRWNVSITPLPRPTRHSTLGLLRETSSSNTPSVKVMTNYLGVGIDAKVALEVHQIRERFPHWFQSQMGNKMWYTGVGAKDLTVHSCARLPTKIEVQCDGVPINLPPNIEGLLVLNIPNHMGGVDLWGTGFDSDVPQIPGGPGSKAPRRQAVSDGMLELVGIFGVVHMGKLQVGLARAVRICQCRYVALTCREELAMQVDGEPWTQAPAQLLVTHRGQAVMLRRVGKTPAARVAAAVAEVLDASVMRGVINKQQRTTLTSDLSARLEALV